MISKICDGQPCGNNTKALIERSELAQKRLERRLAYTPFLWAGRILQRLQAIQNNQGSTMRDELRESLALLPCRADPGIGITKPTESRVNKFVCG